MAYIEREAVEKEVDDIIRSFIADKTFQGNFAAGVICDIRDNVLAKAPTVDAVEVVRCKDCNKSDPSKLFGCGWRYCLNNRQHHKDDHFCGYGERRGSEWL